MKNGEKNVEKHKDMTSENDNKQVMIKKTADVAPAFDKREKGNSVNLSKQQLEILQVIADNKVLSTIEISIKTGLSKVVVNRHLRALQNMGLLVHEDGRMGGKWKVKTD